MLRNRILLWLLVSSLSLSACSKQSDTARLKLAEMSIPYTEMDFVESAREGNKIVVGLFLDAGMDTEKKARDGQTAC